MHVVLTRQSVIIKCNLEASVMLGNYEFYYASGLLFKFTGHEVAEDIQPDALMEQVQEVLKTYEPADGKEKHLKKMLKYYQVEEGYDDQMKELLQMGLNEKKLWERHL